MVKPLLSFIKVPVITRFDLAIKVSDPFSYLSSINTTDMNYLELKEKVDAWLASEDSDIESGAKLLVSLNRNRILYQNITRQGEKARKKLVYELGKQSIILGARANEVEFRSLTEQQVQVFEEKIEKLNEDVLPKVLNKTIGKREDHSQLPAEAIAAFDKNEDLYPKLRSTHERLKLMNNDSNCDRYPFLKQLTEIADEIQDNWDTYDNAVITPTNSATENNDSDPLKTEETPETKKIQGLTAQEVSSHRAYISRNRAKLMELKTTGNIPGYENLKANMQQRYDIMVTAGESFDPETTKSLEELGLIIKKDETSQKIHNQTFDESFD